MVRWVFFDLRQSFLDGQFDSLGQRLSGQAGKPFRQGVRIGVFDVQRHPKILHYRTFVRENEGSWYLIEIFGV